MAALGRNSTELGYKSNKAWSFKPFNPLPKLSKLVENTVGKGEIACYEQFLLFPLCFQKACFPGTSKGVIVWEWVKLPTHLLGSSITVQWVSPEGKHHSDFEVL